MQYKPYDFRPLVSSLITTSFILQGGERVATGVYIIFTQDLIKLIIGIVI